VSTHYLTLVNHTLQYLLSHPDHSPVVSKTLIMKYTPRLVSLVFNPLLPTYRQKAPPFYHHKFLFSPAACPSILKVTLIISVTFPPPPSTNRSLYLALLSQNAFQHHNQARVRRTFYPPPTSLFIFSSHLPQFFPFVFVKTVLYFPPLNASQFVLRCDTGVPIVPL